MELHRSAPSHSFNAPNESDEHDNDTTILAAFTGCPYEDAADLRQPFEHILGPHDSVTLPHSLLATDQSLYTAPQNHYELSSMSAAALYSGIGPPVLHTEPSTSDLFADSSVISLAETLSIAQGSLTPRDLRQVEQPTSALRRPPSNRLGMVPHLTSGGNDDYVSRVVDAFVMEGFDMSTMDRILRSLPRDDQGCLQSVAENLSHGSLMDALRMCKMYYGRSLAHIYAALVQTEQRRGYRIVADMRASDFLRRMSYELHL